ncbi:hypothetical protein Tco_0549072 [Tanacetum coccineum]
MNQEEIRQVTARDEKLVPTNERVKICTTNVRLETTVSQKEDTFQVIIDVIKNFTRYTAFTISAEVPKIFMQQFWYTVKKVTGTNSYEFHLANKKCLVDAELFWKILDICLRVQGEDFTKVQMMSLLLLSSLIFVTKEYGLPIPETMLNEGIKQSESYQMFIKYSTSLIPPKKSRAAVEDSDESDSEPARKQTASRRVIKKKVSISADDNIIPELDVASELGKSMSLTEAAEEEAGRQVHATHERIVIESDLEPTRRIQSGIAFRDTSSVSKKMSPDLSQKLKGIQTLTPKEKLVADTIQALNVTPPNRVLAEYGSESVTL